MEIKVYENYNGEGHNFVVEGYFSHSSGISAWGVISCDTEIITGKETAEYQGGDNIGARVELVTMDDARKINNVPNEAGRVISMAPGITRVQVRGRYEIMIWISRTFSPDEVFETALDELNRLIVGPPHRKWNNAPWARVRRNRA
jgi:hypothetical protein